MANCEQLSEPDTRPLGWVKTAADRMADGPVRRWLERLAGASIVGGELPGKPARAAAPLPCG